MKSTHIAILTSLLILQTTSITAAPCPTKIISSERVPTEYVIFDKGNGKELAQWSDVYNDIGYVFGPINKVVESWRSSIKACESINWQDKLIEHERGFSNYDCPNLKGRLSVFDAMLCHLDEKPEVSYGNRQGEQNNPKSISTNPSRNLNITEKNNYEMPFSGTWSGRGTNSLGYSRNQSLVFNPIDRIHVDISASVETEEKSFSYNERGTVNGNSMRYSLGESFCTDSLVDAQTLSHYCEGRGTSIKMSMHKTSGLENKGNVSSSDNYPENTTVSNQNSINNPQQPNKFSSEDATHCVEIVPNGFKCGNENKPELGRRYLTNICPFVKISVEYKIDNGLPGLVSLMPKECLPDSPFDSGKGTITYRACSWDKNADYAPFMHPNCHY